MVVIQNPGLGTGRCASQPMEVLIVREMLMDKGTYNSTIHKLANGMRYHGSSDGFMKITENAAKLLLRVKVANT